MIEVSHLTKKYGDRFAVNDLSFSVNLGEVVGFLGPNGAGKTTTMKIITGCLAPDSGNVSIDKEDIFDHSMSTRSKIGYLPEIPPLYGDMTVESYLKYTAKIKRKHPKKAPALALSAMEKVGLKDVRSRLISNLSKGFKQRVGLAQALVSEPDVLILDEPTVGLDPAQVIEIRDLISELKKDRTVILSTHILSEVEANCEKVIIINKGQIVTQGLLSEMIHKMGQRQLYVKVKNPSAQLEGKLKALEGVVNIQCKKDVYTISMSQDINEKVAQTAVSAGLLELRADSLKLEDLFIQVTQ